MTLTIELGQDIVGAHLHTKNHVHPSNGSVVRVLKDGELRWASFLLCTIKLYLWALWTFVGRSLLRKTLPGLRGTRWITYPSPGCHHELRWASILLQSSFIYEHSEHVLAVAYCARHCRAWRGPAYNRRTDRQTHRQTGPILLPQPLAWEVIISIGRIYSFQWNPFMVWNLNPFHFLPWNRIMGPQINEFLPLCPESTATDFLYYNY